MTAAFYWPRESTFAHMSAVSLSRRLSCAVGRWPEGPRPQAPSCSLVGCCPATGGSPLRTTAAAAAPGTIESLRRKHTLSLDSKNVISPADACAFCLQQEGCFLFFLRVKVPSLLCGDKKEHVLEAPSKKKKV